MPTKHNSDEINDFYARDANITLNMFKIKSPKQMGKRNENSSDYFGSTDQKFDKVS